MIGVSVALKARLAIYGSGVTLGTSLTGRRRSDIRAVASPTNGRDFAMEQHRLGKNGPMVSALGLGCMGMSGMYGPADRKESIATIHAALDAGVTLIDTGDFYGMGHNEMLIGEAVKGMARDRFLVSVKFGALRDPKGGWLGYDARPAAGKRFLGYSLQPPGPPPIPLFPPAR